MQKEYKAVFDYYGFEIDENENNLFLETLVKEPMATEFADAYNTFCKLVNPKYEGWNAEFDKLYPDYNGDTDEWQHTYNEWIRVKQQELIDKYINNRRWCNYSSMRFFIDPEIEYQFVGQLKGHPECKICFHLEEV